MLLFPLIFLFDATYVVLLQKFWSPCMIPLFSFYLKSRVFSTVLNILRKCIFLSQWHFRVCFFNVRLCNLKLYPLVELQVVKLQDLKGIFLKMSINITKWPTSHVGGLSLLPFQLAWSSSLKNTTLPTYQVNIAILITSHQLPMNWKTQR